MTRTSPPSASGCGPPTCAGASTPAIGRRSAYPAPVVTNTWQAALDRLMLGSAIHDDDLTLGLRRRRPVRGRRHRCRDGRQPGRGHVAAERPGRRRPAGEVPLEAWIERLGQVLTRCSPPRRHRMADRGPRTRIFADVTRGRRQGGRPSPLPLTFTDVRRLLDERLDAKVGRPDFFRGGITVTSMTPLRWIPYRVVCLLGMDQWAFSSVTCRRRRPGRRRSPDRGPRPSRRSPPVVARGGAGRRGPPSGDAGWATTSGPTRRSHGPWSPPNCSTPPPPWWSPTSGDGLAAHLEISHPRQPFDDRCFEVGRAGRPACLGLRSAPTSWEPRPGGARVSTTAPFLARPLDPVDADRHRTGDLQAVLQEPWPRHSSTQRLEARLPDSEEDVSVLLPMELQRAGRVACRRPAPQGPAGG